ncbi:PQQ-like beta-propeller repeat protein [Halosimplex litoreum]|uniref:PQQ-like beta-propeller repeat protein n=1 Tax=Halosimplex litoreum TaxID=1198301 RepID=A0A7T3KWR3_9EURY|nr:PQQ-binding-like beta-propeller repeat protein [Halosimplex litoreum]QPV64185.1 PQQ-like beta-propeller repeat protein [Halosimplex litoreum]
MRRRALLGTTAVGLASLAGCGVARSFRSLASSGSYPQPRYDAANTGYNPTTGPRESRRVYWTLDVSAGSMPLTSGPSTVGDGRTYLPLGAYDQPDGNQLWSMPFPAQFDRLVLGDGLASLTAEVDGERRLHALSADTGEVEWATAPPDGVLAGGTPTLADGVIYTTVKLGEADAAPLRVAAFDADSGDHRWTARTGENAVAPVAVADGSVFVGDPTAERLYALDAADGSLLWQSDRGGRFGTLVVGEETVFAQSVTDGPLQAFATVDGSPRWWRRVGGVAGVAVADGTLYVVARGAEDDADPRAARLLALDAATGERRWETEASATTAPTVTDETVYVGGRPERRTGRIAAYDRSSGEFLWQFDRSQSYEGDALPPSPIGVSSPAVVEDGLFAAVGDRLYALGA